VRAEVSVDDSHLLSGKKSLSHLGDHGSSLLDRKPLPLRLQAIRESGSFNRGVDLVRASAVELPATEHPQHLRHLHGLQLPHLAKAALEHESRWEAIRRVSGQMDLCPALVRGLVGRPADARSHRLAHRVLPVDDSSWRKLWCGHVALRARTDSEPRLGAPARLIKPPLGLF
jgi:hypothetical protein